MVAAEGAAIDGCVGPNLHVIVNDHVANLEHFAVAAFIKHIAVTVRADDGAGVDANPVPNLASARR